MPRPDATTRLARPAPLALDDGADLVADILSSSGDWSLSADVLRGLDGGNVTTTDADTYAADDVCALLDAIAAPIVDDGTGVWA